MKLKQQPEDFRVEELTDVLPGAAGPFALYRLEKRGWTTVDAVQAIRRRWQLDRRRVSYGGLKDRHALTVQYLTIFRGPQRKLNQNGIRLEHLGQVATAYTSHQVRANRFEITLRDLKPDQSLAAVQAMTQVEHEGVPNYFDDQRFGSVGAEGTFVGRAIVLGKYEEALRLALAEPYEHDRPAQKREKAILQRRWGDWGVCKEELPRSHARSLVDYLVFHPEDFRGALERLRPELRGLYLSAFQSYLWNRMLSRWLEEHIEADKFIRVELRLGSVPMHRGLEAHELAALAKLQMPLPSAKVQMDQDDPRVDLMNKILDEEGLTAAQLKLKGFREMFFSKGERAAWLQPTGVRHEVGDDELRQGRQKLTVAFELTRGSYATLLVKRIMFRDEATTGTGSSP